MHSARLKEELAQVAAEKTRAYYSEAHYRVLAGAAVQSVNCLIGFEYSPTWAWLPGLATLYLVTLWRAYLFQQYKADPDQYPPATWNRLQAIAAALAGVCWGFSNTAMLAYLPIESQLLLLVIAAVSATSSGNESFTDPRPPGAFIILSLIPMAVWLLMAGSIVFLLIGLMLVVLAWITLAQGTKQHETYTTALLLRFEKERLAAEIESQRDTVAQAAQAKSRFLAAASHDLRQPIQAMSIFLELLSSETRLTPQGQSLLQRAQQAGDSINRLLDNLLDISKLDTHTTQVQRASLPLEPLLRQLAQEYAPAAREKGLRLRVVPCSAAVDSDPVLLERILRNLISNALRYTPQGKVLVGCRRRGENVEIAVLDTGVGIHEAQQQAIFNEFYQVDSHVRERKDGLGLGLAIVDRIAKLLGHPLQVRSIPQRGSCFSLLLPRVPHPASDVPVAARDQDRLLMLGGQTIAVIENNPDIRLALQTLLSRAGCEVIEAVSSKEVIQKAELREVVPAALIADLGLGTEENGIDCINHLRQHFDPLLPALLLTGDTTQIALSAASRADLVLLHKPISSEALLAALGDAIANPYRNTTPPKLWPGPSAETSDRAPR